jgi:hypothetical protein
MTSFSRSGKVPRSGSDPPKNKKLARPEVVIPGPGEMSSLDERLNLSLRRRQLPRKLIPQRARLSFVEEVASEFEEWLSSALAGQHARTSCVA